MSAETLTWIVILKFALRASYNNIFTAPGELLNVGTTNKIFFLIISNNFYKKLDIFTNPLTRQNRHNLQHLQTEHDPTYQSSDIYLGHFHAL